MGNTNNTKKVDSLDLEISMIQTMEIMDKFDESQRIFAKGALKKFFLCFAPIAGLLVASFITKNSIPISVGVGLLGAGAVFQEVKSLIKIDKEISDTMYSGIKTDDFDEDDIVPEISKTNKHEIYTGKDFYSEQYKAFIRKQKEPTNNDLEKYSEALGKQRTRMTHGNIKLVKDERNYLTKEETKDQISYEMCVFMNCYELPPINIQDYELEIYFDEIYKFFKSIGVEKRYYERLSGITRLMIAKVLLDVKKRGKQDMTIKDFIKALKYLKLYEVKNTDIENLQKEILRIIKETKVISLADYLNKKEGRTSN